MKHVILRNAFSYKAAASIAALVLAFYVEAAAAKPQQSEAASSAPVIVQPKFGGQILGYDIDRNGTEGLVSEYVAEKGGVSLVATEVFDQKTGAITQVVAKENHTLNDYVVQPINTDDLGLVLFQESGQNNFLTLDPFTANKFTGVWTPPIGASEISVAQGEEAAVFASSLSENVSYVMEPISRKIPSGLPCRSHRSFQWTNFS
jgi:hypothetical protein